MVGCGLKNYYFYLLISVTVMSAFIGNFTCKFDAKGRIVLPAPFKRIMVSNGSDRFVLRKDLFEDCLVLMPYEQWEKERQKIKSKINVYNRDHNRFFKSFFKELADLSFDGNGRLLIPRKYKDHIGVDSEVVLVGVDDHIELWNKQAFDSMELSPEEMGALAEKILGGDEKDMSD